MSVSRARATRAYILGVLACGLAVGGCYHNSGIAPRPARPTQRVNVGYGTQSTEQTGGSVESATVDESSDRQTGRPEEILAGRFPSVRLFRDPAGGLVVSIRGSALWSASNQPLYVVDGLPVQVTPGRGLDWLVPEQIARIVVLKDPAETSMYGGRGANGVILITTKGP
jgi:TonB-dependent starch-binding outer membrane protein SusC